MIAVDCQHVKYSVLILVSYLHSFCASMYHSPCLSTVVLPIHSRAMIQSFAWLTLFHYRYSSRCTIEFVIIQCIRSNRCDCWWYMESQGSILLSLYSKRSSNEPAANSSPVSVSLTYASVNGLPVTLFSTLKTAIPV